MGERMMTGAIGTAGPHRSAAEMESFDVQGVVQRPPAIACTSRRKRNGLGLNWRWLLYDPSRLRCPASPPFLSGGTRTGTAGRVGPYRRVRIGPRRFDPHAIDEADDGVARDRRPKLGGDVSRTFACGPELYNFLPLFVSPGHRNLLSRVYEATTGGFQFCCCCPPRHLQSRAVPNRRRGNGGVSREPAR